MKCLTILFLKILLLSNSVMAEVIPTKSKILKQYTDCIKSYWYLIAIKKDALKEHLGIKGRNRLQRLPLNSILKKFTCRKCWNS